MHRDSHASRFFCIEVLLHPARHSAIHLRVPAVGFALKVLHAPRSEAMRDRSKRTSIIFRAARRVPYSRSLWMAC